MSEMQFPPAGTMCVDCGCCQANVYAAGDPLCWACDAGNHGAKKEAPKPAPLAAPAREIPPAVEKPEPGRITTVAQLMREDAARIMKATPLPTEETMPQKPKPGAVPCAITGCSNFAYPPNKYCTKKHYYYVQHPEKASGAAGQTKTRTFAKPAPKPAAIVRHAPAAAAIESPGCAVAITGQITPAGADKFWWILSLEQKSQIIQASLRSILTAEVV